MIQLRRWSTTIILLLLVVVGLGFIKFTQIKAAMAFGASFPESSETVQATQTNWSTWQPTVTVVGQVKAQQVADIRNELEGMITKVDLPSGALVNKGDVLIQLNIDSEQAQLDAIGAEIELAKLEVKRFTDLLKVSAASKELLDRANAQLAVSKARARGLAATIAKKTITAPFTGKVGINDWQVGAYLPANSIITNIIGVSENGLPAPVWIDFNLPQIYAQVALGTTVQVQAKGITQASVQATVSVIDQRLNETSRTLRARANLVSDKYQLPPGAVVSVVMPAGEPISVIPLPNQAIRYDAFGSYVFVLEKDDNGDYRAARQPVTVLHKELSQSFVSEGLEESQTVATIGSAKLFPNILTYIAE
jgi:membrane fusion protein (multidrug efflux system)